MVGARRFDEQEVIAIALDVFWRKGLHDATMQDLATATGVQRGSLYNAYGDKEAIFLRAFDQYAEQFLETSGNALAQGDAAAKLQNFFDVIIANMTSGSPPRGCLTTRTALDVAISSTAVRQRVQGLLGRLEQLIGKALGSAPSKPPAIDAIDLLVSSSPSPEDLR
jgi:AcrR family transcriptional regulator